MSVRLDAGDIARRLSENIVRLAEELLPGGRRDGRLWRAGSLAGEAGQSLAVTLYGPQRGRWYEFNGNYGGDALDLVVQTRCSGDLVEALKWARGWLGLGELDPAELASERKRAQELQRRRQDSERREEMAKRHDARRIWLAAAPLREGDLVWRYLAGRGIDLAALPRLPGAIRCHPGLWHSKSAHAWPAMVAAIAGPDGTHMATQRTWIEPQSNGEVTKAPLGHDAKMTLGSYCRHGGAVHLTRGASGRPWRDAEPGGTVAFSEGIEDGLTFACLRPDLRVAACCTSLAYLAHVALPPETAKVVAIVQNDPPRSDAAKALARGLKSLRSKGLMVAVMRPPVFVKDLNDYVNWLRRMPVAEEVLA